MTATQLLAKHGIKPTRNKVANDKVAVRANEIIKECNGDKAIRWAAKGPSRNDLMLQVKEKGVKNFRILNREELLKTLEMIKGGATQEQIAGQVVAPAVTRWKFGWGTKKVASA